MRLGLARFTGQTLQNVRQKASNGFDALSRRFRRAGCLRPGTIDHSRNPAAKVRIRGVLQSFEPDEFGEIVRPLGE